ncbi:hypothetical protein OHB41_01235 [Streptomyces sp. NBC_01571]|uniref:hypothetical protein n=1 Tax=Streptomyces sp. NBC_01571 TaxID=2975883 RepID=UPI002259C1F8|nr:hypothetical protein [Streptomyces sp. NBC_01571]MCX4571847.1 hypothetical protein [Streptomyces sp. NBC_01571]
MASRTDSLTRLGDKDYGARPPDPGRRQLTLYASHTGEVAPCLRLSSRGASAVAP